MAKAFSLASWNVEHFRSDPARAARVLEFLAQQDPDLFALYEVEGREVFSALMKKFPGYTFHITEGEGAQEILVGVRGGISAFFTQRIEFTAGLTSLRPGSLLSVVIGSETYTLLFLHLKSYPTPIGFGVRDDQLERAIDFRKVLDKAAGGAGKANYLFLGDLNTMGLDYPFQKKIDAPTEIQKLDREAAKKKLRRLTKPGPSWRNADTPAGKEGDLDHVVASDHLQFRQFGGFDVALRGWPELATEAQRKKWIGDFSDHALVYFEVQKV